MLVNWRGCAYYNNVYVLQVRIVSIVIRNMRFRMFDPVSVFKCNYTYDKIASLGQSIIMLIGSYFCCFFPKLFSFKS